MNYLDLTAALVAIGLVFLVVLVRRQHSRMSSAVGQQGEVKSDDYSFRIRVDRAPADTIGCLQHELSLEAPGDAVQISLQSKAPDCSLQDAKQFLLIGSGYSDENEAQRAGRFYERVLMIALTASRVGVDFGRRAAKGIFSSHGLKMLEEQYGGVVLNDVHGLTTYCTKPKPRFAHFKGEMLRSASADAFGKAFRAAAISNLTVSEKECLAFDLFNASFFQTTADSRLLLLVMAIEALIEPKLRSSEAQTHVKSLLEATKRAAISAEERASMLGAMQWLKTESINQAGRRLVSERLGSRVYDGRSAADFYSHIYSMRSNLVHGSHPYPTYEAVGAAAGQIEVFVSELLTSPFVTLPDQM
jgi:hypothetical protein